MSSLLSRLMGRGGRVAAPVSAPHAKASRTGPLIAFPSIGRPVWTPRDYAALAREGYQRNAVVYRAVRMVAEAAASVPLLVYRDGREEPDHPLARLLARPNPRDASAALFDALYGHLLVAGNAYLELASVRGEPRELYALRPDRMKVVPGPDGWAQAYDYTVGARTVRFAQDHRDGGDGPPPILHLTLFNPLDDHYGFAPTEAAAVALDIHNAAGAWNKALLDNAARPSGALVYAGAAGMNLSDEQFDRIKEELEASFQGAANAGRPLLLEGGLDWKPLSMSPKDMDFIQAKAAAAREIALAFGVPPMLLGLPGDNTYSNYAEANRSFWRQTVIPLVTRTAASLAHWLAPAFDGALRLEPDLDGVDALAPEREALWARIGAAGFLTDDEKREAVGYGAKPASARPGAGKGGWGGVDPLPGDVVASPAGGDGLGGGGGGSWQNQPRVPAGNPEGGQWTDGSGEGQTNRR
ncbi:portal protein [Alsobacter metallidurans]|uniref:Portal protein n=1 Tax=Alsobacter metallidurans TaxID=340221 RepID=A0A917I4H6_9HYPH|nr:phage portal protein [Alsobacter metallidurans]GGH13834.1 portal protein [Alsobacter metallidurans]